MLIFAIDDSPMPTLDALLARVNREFGSDHVRVRERQHASESAVFAIMVDPANETSFRVAKLDPTGTLTTDGTLEQDSKIAAIVRSLLPPTYPRVIGLMKDGSQFVDLPYGVTPEAVSAGWKDISEGNFE